MRHRIKKIPSLIHSSGEKLLCKQSHLLHSDKSIKECAHRRCSLNTLFLEARSWRLPSQRSALCASLPASLNKESKLSLCSLSSAFRSANPPRKSGPSAKKVFTGAAHTYFYNNKLVCLVSRYKTIPLVLSSFALLLVLGMMMFPAIDNEVMALGDKGMGQDDDYGIDTQAEMNLSLGLSGNSIGSNEDGSAPAVVGKPSYGGVTLTATATDINPLTGYSIYVQTTGADTRLKNNIDDSNVIDTITEEAGVTGENIPLNHWGYAIQRLDTPDQQVSYPTMTFKGVSPSGDTSATAAHGKENLNNAKFALAFGANIGSDKLAGHYRTDVLVSLVAEAKTMVTYSLSYDGNGNTSGTAPNTAIVESREDSYEFTVAGKGTLEKTNAEFLGWATTADATEAEYTEGSKLTLYRKSDEAESTSSQTLYAVWKTTTVLPPIEGEITTKFGDFTYMQDPGLKDYCQNSSTPDKTSGQLADGRDGKIYWVTKLAGTCWMTQDLDLDLGPNGPALTTANDGDNLYKGSATSWDGGKSVASSNKWTQSDFSTVDWYDRNASTTTNTQTDSSANGTHQADHKYLGNLYSYEAATAGTGSTVTSDGGEVPGSICPAGWKLPLSGGTSVNKGIGSFNSLKDAGMTSNTAANGAPYYFQYGGYIGGSLLHDVGGRGFYWSATSSSSSSAYSLFFYTRVDLNTADSLFRYSGFSVRCVVR